jgi:hypothetical protein
MNESMMAFIGFGGFGKQAWKSAIDPRRFDKNKQEVGFP